MNTFVEAGVTIALSVVGLAILSVILSKNSNASGVIQSLASGLGNNVAVATAPVTGANVSPNLGYPSGGNSFANAFSF